MIGDLRATLQETHDPTAQWSAMMGWLKRWWLTLDAGGQEEALGYLMGYAERLPDATRAAPPWLMRELMWTPEHALGALIRRVSCALVSEVPGVVAIMQAWPACKVSLRLSSWDAVIMTLDPARICWLSCREPDTLWDVAYGWLGRLSALESLEVVTAPLGSALWLHDALQASAPTLEHLTLDVPGLDRLLLYVEQLPRLASLSLGSYLMEASWLAPDDGGALAETLGGLAWPETVTLARITHNQAFTRLSDALYTGRLGAQLEDCFVPGHLAPEALEGLWARLPNATRFELTGWRALTEACVDVLAPRLGTLRTIRTAGEAAPLVARLTQLEDSALEALTLSGLDLEHTHMLDRWLAARPPGLRSVRLELDQPHDLDALVQGARRGAFRALEDWGGSACEHIALLHMLARAPEGLPSLRWLTLDEAREDELVSGLHALTPSAPSAIERVVIEPTGDPVASTALFGWLAGAPVTYLECNYARFAPESLDAWVENTTSMTHIEHLRCWDGTCHLIRPEALHRLLASAPWLSSVTLESDAALHPSLARALLDAPTLEDLTLDHLDAHLARALVDALLASDHPLRLRRVYLHALDPEEEGAPPLALVRQLRELLRQRTTPGVDIQLSGVPGLETTP